MSRADNEFAGIVGVRIDPMTKKPIQGLRELDHFYKCALCGQSVDRRDLGEVMHHEQADHVKLPTS